MQAEKSDTKGSQGVSSVATDFHVTSVAPVKDSCSQNIENHFQKPILKEMSLEVGVEIGRLNLLI